MNAGAGAVGRGLDTTRSLFLLSLSACLREGSGGGNKRRERSVGRDSVVQFRKRWKTWLERGRLLLLLLRPRVGTLDDEALSLFSFRNHRASLLFPSPLPAPLCKPRGSAYRRKKLLFSDARIMFAVLSMFTVDVRSGHFSLAIGEKSF